MSATLAPLRQLLAEGRFEEIVSALGNWQRAETPVPALEALSVALGQLGHLEQAHDVLQALLQRDGNRPDWWLALARLQWRQGHYQQALEGFVQAFRNSRNPSERLPYIQALMSLNQDQQAEDCLEELASTGPAAALLRTQLLWNRQQYQIATQTLTQALSMQSTPHLETAAAIAQLLAKQPDAAKTHARQIPEQPRLQVMWECAARMHARNPLAPALGTSGALMGEAISQAPPGRVVECGVYFGRSINDIARRCPERRIDGFDSFQGLPGDWTEGESAGSYSTEGRMPRVADNVCLHAGWFDDTLPDYAASLDEPIGLLHVDCDIYSSTCSALKHLGPCLAPGAVIVFDDFFGYPGYQQHEWQAFDEHRQVSGQAFTLIGWCAMGREAAFRHQP